MVRPLWIEVDLKALRHNFIKLRDFLGRGVKIIATVKQSAYGHGLLPTARMLCKEGVDFFGVGSVEEAVALRDDGFQGRVLVLSALLKDFCRDCLLHNVIPTITDLSFAARLDKEASRYGKRIPVHVKVDTGMGRIGFSYTKAFMAIKRLKDLKNIILEGIYTHFPAADTDPEFTDYQIRLFNGLLSSLSACGIRFKFRHCANSIGILKYPRARFNAVRPGLVIYGVNPSGNPGFRLVEALSLKSRVVFIKEIFKGSTVGYGRSFIAQSRRRIATVSCGYADGYPWALSNKSRAIIKGCFFPLAGRVCMDHVMFDLGSRSDIKVKDEVVLIGKSGNKKIKIEELARLCGTIPYEIVSRLSLSIPRIYKE